MKPISSTLRDHLTGELTTVAYLIKISRLDAVIKGFTTFDRSLTVYETIYKAESTVTSSALESKAGLGTDNLEITGILNSDDIAAADIEIGLYDHARIDVYACNWADLTQGTMQLRRG